MNIGILYIATGRYICFWKEFYETAKKYLFTNHNLTYFLFTDAKDVVYENEPDVKKYNCEKYSWPYVALNKYKILLLGEKEYADMDYIFYFNANMIFKNPVGDEILPDERHSNLAVAVWPNQWGKTDSDQFPYDRNPDCSANIAYGEGKYYLMGGLHGGKPYDYIQMCKTLDEMTQNDVKKGVIAKCHDESYINKYFTDKDFLVITPDYAMPKNWKIKGFEKNIKGEIVKKHHWKYGGHAYLRGESDKKITPLKFWLNKLFKLNLK